MILLQELLRHQGRRLTFLSNGYEKQFLLGCKLIQQGLIGKALLGKDAIYRHPDIIFLQQRLIRYLSVKHIENILNIPGNAIEMMI
mgnify:CR=1 FL=1